MSSKTRQQLEAWVKSIKVNAMVRVLDIGGSQLPVKKRVGEKGEASHYDILDLVEPHEFHAPVDIVWDINKRFPTDKQIDLYDVVFCLEVMEYVWNPVQALQNMNRFLKKGGSLFISTPFIYPVHNPKDQDYLRYTERGIRKLLEETGFEVIEDASQSRYSEHSNLIEAFYSIDGMKPARDYDGHDVVGSLISAKKI